MKIARTLVLIAGVSILSASLAAAQTYKPTEYLQLVRVHVWTPTDLTREQREAIESLQEIEDAPPEPRRGEDPSFWERVKAAFTA